VGSQDFATHFVDEALSPDVAHINNLPFLGNDQVVLGILSSCVARQPSYFTRTIPPPSCLFRGFRRENYVGMWGHYGSKIVGVFLKPFNKVLGLSTDILWWYRPFFLWRIVPHLFF